MVDVVKVPNRPTSGSLGMVTSFRGPQTLSRPAEWAGLFPLVDWDMRDTVTVGSNPQLMHIVPDRSGHPGRDLVSAGGSASPQFSGSYAPMNGAPVVSFAYGSNKHATFTNLGIDTNGPFSIVIVAQTPRIDTNAYLISLLNQNMAIYADNLGTGNLTGWGAANQGLISTGISAGSPRIYMHTLNGSTQRAYVSSTTEAGNNTSNGGTFSGAGFISGYAAINQDLYTWGGVVARVIVFDKELTLAERTIVMNALGSKYGITIT